MKGPDLFGTLLIAGGGVLIAAGIALALALGNWVPLIATAVGVFDVVVGAAIRGGRMARGSVAEQAAGLDDRGGVDAGQAARVSRDPDDNPYARED